MCAFQGNSFSERQSNKCMQQWLVKNTSCEEDWEGVERFVVHCNKEDSENYIQIEYGELIN